MNHSKRDGQFMPSRRQAVKTVVAGAGAAILGTHSAVTSAKEIRPPYTEPFVDELPVYLPKTDVPALIPAAQEYAHALEAGRDAHQGWGRWPAKKFYKVEVKEAWHKFHRDLQPQPIWGYDGLLPGPTFVAREGEPSIVRFYNMLQANVNGFGSPEISTHLHNGHTGSESDGYAGNYFSPTKYGPTLTRGGQYYDHHYPNCFAGYDKYPDTDGDPNESMGTLWYHDHREGFTAANVYRGLAGFYLMFDKVDSGDERDMTPGALRLPSGVGQYDIPLMFQDQLFDSSGRRMFDQFETDGFLGNKFCVNGKVQPTFKVARRKYRFRLLDGSPSRFYEFCLKFKGVNQPFKYIANDGNLLPAPLTAQTVRIAPAERADIIVDFTNYQIGDQLFLVNTLNQISGRGPDPLLAPIALQILRFEVDRDAPDYSEVPPVLRPLPPIDLASVEQKRRFEFERENGVWVVNGKVFDVEKATVVIRKGTAEIWTLVGKGGWHHPIHIHMEEGRILSRNGKPPAPHEAGRKDVFVLNPGDEVKVFLRFRDFTGKYMMHCHNTVHEDHSMMLRFDIKT
jgi:FtsP/CotA-like multicopper oxidase with cupredoxin domain